MPLEATAIDARTILLETAAVTLEQMAFVCIEPLAESGDAPDDAVEIAMDFRGPRSGVVELVAPRAFGRHLAQGILMIEADDEMIDFRGEDCLREMINVIVGAMMPRLSDNPAHGFDLGLPMIGGFHKGEWASFTAGPDAAVFDADGHRLCLRLTYH